MSEGSENSVFFLGVFTGLLLGAIIGIWLGQYIGERDIRQEAAKAGAGQWSTDTDGRPVYAWKTSK